MDVIGHNYKRIQSGRREMIRGVAPTSCHHFTAWTQLCVSLDDLAQETPPFPSTDRHKVGSIPGIVESRNSQELSAIHTELVFA